MLYWVAVKLNGKLFALLGIVLAMVVIASLIESHCKKNSNQVTVDALSPLPRIQGILKQGKAVFLSPEFPNLLPHDSRRQIPSLGESIACRDITSFYRLNRERHFSAIFLGIRPSSLPLVRELLSSPLWVLGEVLPGGYLFLPAGSAAWSIPEAALLEKDFPQADLRAEWLTGTASSLIAIGHHGEADQLLAMAETTQCKKPLVLATRASLEASRGDWNQALEFSRESLRRDHSNLMARMIEIRALSECGRADEALDKARLLVEASGNQETFFLLARAANAAHANQEEIDALQHLVALARGAGQPLGASLTYLGQAYAKQGNRGEALRTFQEAFATPELTGEQRLLLRGIMDHLMEGEKSSSSLPPLETPPSPPTHNTEGTNP